jgi:hypothetical protein
MREAAVVGRHPIMGVSFVGVLMGLIKMLGFIFVAFFMLRWVFYLCFVLLFWG